MPVHVLLNGVPHMTWVRRWGRRRLVQAGWFLPPIPPSELTQWEAFSDVEGPVMMHRRIDHAGATVAYVLAALNARHGYEPEFEDFMPRWDDTEPMPRQDPESIMAFIDTLARRKFDAP